MDEIEELEIPTEAVRLEALRSAYPDTAKRGMTLREHYIGQALAGSMWSTVEGLKRIERVAEACIDLADEIIRRLAEETIERKGAIKDE